MTHNIGAGPIAPENNPPIQPQNYQPSVFDISAITLGQTTTVTTSVDHNYVVGQLVKLLIPFTFGSVQLNGKSGFVLSIPSATQLEIGIDSSIGVNAYIASPTYGPTPAQIIAVGDTNTGQINIGRANNTTFIQGSFINISPQ